jgi:DnaD/phage-associated family protein
MKLFSGFPDGKVQVTPLPNLFFSELLPGIDDLAELKITLHLFWLLANRKNRLAYVRAGELAADRTLIQSLAAIDAKPEAALKRGLTLATERGTLLRWTARSGEGDAEEDLYFVNSEAGRRAFERIGGGEPSDARPVETEPVPPVVRPNIFALYEKNIGMLTPMISEELREAEKEYPAEWIEDAFKIAVDNNKRNWSYIRKILTRWQTEGRSEGAKKKKTWYGDEYSKFVKR